MKKILLFAILSVLGMTQMAAQEYEYVPFVREGVKWVYYYNNPFWNYILDMDFGIQYFSFEMKGDVLIGDKYYKPVILTHYLDDGNEQVEDDVPIYLREENKVVYAIHPDGIQHPQCPVGTFSYISDPESLPIKVSDEEFVLYDFNDAIELYGEGTAGEGRILYQYTDTITTGNHYSKCHHYQDLFLGEEDNKVKIIEGIGYDGAAGMPLFYFMELITGLQVGYHLSHVIEDGKIIYKGGIKGDVNGDNKATIADVTALIDYLLGDTDQFFVNHIAADVNDNGEITISDVTALIDLLLTQ